MLGLIAALALSLSALNLPSSAGPLAAPLAPPRTIVVRAELPAGCPTYITITQYPTDPYFQATANITVEYGEDMSDPFCLSAGGPDPATFQFTVNGVNRTSYFNVGANQAVGTNVPLVDEALNTLLATIQGYDTEGNPVENQDTKTTNVDTTPKPTVYTTPYNPDAQDLARCAASCFWATYAQSTVSYFSLDAPRNVTLVYHGARVNPRAFVHVDVEHPGGTSNVPQEFWLEVKVDGAFATFSNDSTKLRFTGPSQRVRLGGQLRDSTRATGVYTLDILVTSKYPNKTETAVNTTRLVVVNETNAAIARGWTLAGVQRLYVLADSSALIAEGDGSAVFFHRPCPTCSYVTPLGEFSKLTRSGTTYVRAYPDSTRVTFDNTGRMIRVADRFGTETA